MFYYCKQAIKKMKIVRINRDNERFYLLVDGNFVGLLGIILVHSTCKTTQLVHLPLKAETSLCFQTETVESGIMFTYNFILFN